MQQQLNKVKKETTFVKRTLDFGIEVNFYIPFTFLLNEVDYEYITSSIIKYIKYLRSRLWQDRTLIDY